MASPAFPAAQPLDPLFDLLGTPDEEFVPVDHFFETYVAELNSRSKRAHEPGGLEASKAAKMAAGQTAGAGYPQAAAAHVQAGAPGSMQPPFVASGAPGQQAGISMMGYSNLPFSLPPGGHQVPPTQQQMGAQQAVLVPPGMLANPYTQLAAPAAYGGHTGGIAVPDLQLSGNLSYGLAPAGAPAPLAGQPSMPHVGGPGTAAVPPAPVDSQDGGSHGADSRRGKTVRQQEANKIAQQRYRERKKQKFGELEAQVAELTAQLAALQALQSRNSLLEGLNGQLQAQLVSREREVERLKLALDAAADRSLGAGRDGGDSPGCGSERSHGTAGGDEAYTPLAGACDLLPQDLAGIDFKKGFGEQIELLRRFVERHGLKPGAGPDEGLSEVQVSELGGLVARSCQLCQAALRSEGVRVIDLITRDPASLASADGTGDTERWQRCLAAMRLSVPQQEVMLLNRRRHLARMRDIYQERQQLNMQAMSLMLPQASRDPAQDTTVEGRLRSMGDAGYLRVARASAQLGEVLDAVKDNLRREQRAVMELNCALISRVLTPLQAAYYMLEAYPQHCDALALSNTLARQLGRESEEHSTLPAAEEAAQLGQGCCKQEAGCC